ncbi:MAG: pyrroloquinoline quinone biosynthesis protein PqqE [Hyphomicrobiaceae bacterium]|nr:pyrroloquinoline quinone biosynthesis protein PqqE [Hyphomicrobiaceae bacterium]
MLAEVTHRCPLACPYCSNPVQLDRRSDELDTAAWLGVFEQAAALGVLQLHLSGGEPAARPDIVELTRGAAAAGLYTNLITSGIGLSAARLEALAGAGLDHVQLSWQDTDSANADEIAGFAGAYARKQETARAVIALGLPLTINVVVHRLNIGRVAEMAAAAHRAGARRIEIAHAQYYGWGLVNRAALLPTLDQVEAAHAAVARVRQELQPAILVDYVAPDHFSRWPKPCMNGWGRQSLNVTPRGKVLPCHAAETIPGLVFWNVREHPLREIWEASPAFTAFRGEAWMKEPCRSCPRKEIDFGGCRCQAFAWTGDAADADPACQHSPHHAALRAAVAAPRTDGLRYRRFSGAPAGPGG